jgi:hypothetical protein
VNDDAESHDSMTQNLSPSSHVYGLSGGSHSHLACCMMLSGSLVPASALPNNYPCLFGTDEHSFSDHVLGLILFLVPFNLMVVLE